FNTGGPAIHLYLATIAAGSRNRQRRVGEGHLGATLPTVNGFLQFCCDRAAKWRKPAVHGILAAALHKGRRGIEQPQPGEAA
ncbi:hypothetical protein, partial [Qipengyuania sp.]|uniref:hypothetical protein n=1 Tax=Qipengyuania sp. TaxID=2004515 RepID=UPI003AF41C2B